MQAIHCIRCGGRLTPYERGTIRWRCVRCDERDQRECLKREQRQRVVLRVVNG